MRRPYHVLDVFTDTPLCGNPLAVVLDADDLPDARMQAIAREFNLSETVFVLRPRDDANTARLRIFTPAAELPFAGHPTVGSAVLLAQLRAGDLLATTDVAVALEQKIGLVTCDVRGAGVVSTATFPLPQMPAALAHDLAPATVAEALGLAVDDIGFEDHRPSVFTAGVPFCFVPLADARAIARATPAATFASAFAAAGAPKAFIYTRDTVGMAHDFQARMFGSGLGVAEDPATGSAAAAFAGVLARFEGLPDGLHRIAIEQGYQMKRPSLITLIVDMAGGALGDCVGVRGRRAGCRRDAARMNVESVLVDDIVCRFEARDWPFARKEAARIDAYWASLCALKGSALFNGRVLIAYAWDIVERDGRRRLEAACLPCDYKAFIAWRDFDSLDKTVWNLFAMAALQAADGALPRRLYGRRHRKCRARLLPGRDSRHAGCARR